MKKQKTYAQEDIILSADPSNIKTL